MLDDELDDRSDQMFHQATDAEVEEVLDEVESEPSGQVSPAVVTAMGVVLVYVQLTHSSAAVVLELVGTDDGDAGAPVQGSHGSIRRLSDESDGDQIQVPELV